MPGLNFVKKASQKTKIYSKYGCNKSEKCRNNHNAAEKSPRRLNIERFKDLTSYKRKCASGHTASRAGYTISLFQPAGADKPGDIDFVSGCQPQKSEERQNSQKNKQGRYTLMNRCTVKKFRFILLFVCLHNKVKIW